MASILTWMRAFGLDPKKTLSGLRGISRYRRQRRQLRTATRGAVAWGCEIPILDEWSESSGHLGAYFHQDLQVARWIYQDQPARHIDVGSRIDGFIAHLAVFREVEVIDIRPQPAAHANIVFRQLDLMEELPDEWSGCTGSLSCLHTIEHFGLGRYGDTPDPDGHLKGIAQLQRMVKPGGVFYLSTQVGPERIEFNAHRVFAPETVLGWFADGWIIEKCALIDDKCKLSESTDTRLLSGADCRTGVGIVAARKGR